MTSSKLIRLSSVYAIVALVSGVFYREFTKMMDFSGKTTLSLVHVHLFVLGTLLFLLLALFSQITDLTGQKHWKTFYRLYNISLPFMAVMFAVRGVIQVVQPSLSRGADAAVSGIAGISHILMTICLILLFSALKGSVKSNGKEQKEKVKQN